jgi:hypothetical protein
LGTFRGTFITIVLYYAVLTHSNYGILRLKITSVRAASVIEMLKMLYFDNRHRPQTNWTPPSTAIDQTPSLKDVSIYVIISEVLPDGPG